MGNRHARSPGKAVPPRPRIRSVTEGSYPMPLSAFVCLLMLASAAPDEEGFVPLSGGEDLAGWTVMGADSWRAEGGELVCSGEGTGWLRSDRLYSDFTLRFEYRIGKGGNSGVWLRAPLRGRQSAVGFEFQILGDRATSPNRDSNGSLYNVVAPRLDPARAPGEWNEAEVRCLGSRVRVELNGEELYDVDLADPALQEVLPEGMRPADRNLRGFLGLTNHGAEVHFRNLRIREEPEIGFEPLGSGEGLEGWGQTGAATWQREAGALRASDPAGGLLLSERKLGDYRLRLRYRVQPGTKAFVALRHVETNRNRIRIALADDAVVPFGVESSGALLGYGAPRWVAALPAGEWNDLEVVERGLTLEVRLNGARVLDGSVMWYSGFYLPPLEGGIGLGLTSGAVEFADVRVGPP